MELTWGEISSRHELSSSDLGDRNELNMAAGENARGATFQEGLEGDTQEEWPGLMCAGGCHPGSCPQSQFQGEGNEVEHMQEALSGLHGRRGSGVEQSGSWGGVDGFEMCFADGPGVGRRERDGNICLQQRFVECL